MSAASLLDVGHLSALTTPAFRRALYEQATAAGFDPDAINAVIAVESGFNPNIQNAGGAPALGLLQFWDMFFPAVAARAGRPDVQWDDLRSLTAEQQVPFVIAYFQGTPIAASSKPHDAGDYYVATLLPAFVGAPDATVVGVKGSTDTLLNQSGGSTGLSLGKVYSQNAWLDKNGTGRITVADIKRPTRSLIAAAQSLPRVAVDSSSSPAPSKTPGASSLLALAGSVFFCRSCGARQHVVDVVPDGVRL